MACHGSVSPFRQSPPRRRSLYQSFNGAKLHGVSFQMNFFRRIQIVMFSTPAVLLLTISAIYGQQCFDDGNEFCIDENDILSVDLLPGSFLFADQRASKNVSTTFENDVADGSIRNALNEMEYHR